MEDDLNVMKIKLKDYLPIRSYFSVFNTIWNRPVPKIYVLDMEGVGGIDGNIIGVFVLLKQYAREKSATIEVINYSSALVERISSILIGNTRERTASGCQAATDKMTVRV